MKIIPFYKNEKELIRKAASNSREAQGYLYEKYAPKMLGVCRRYISDLQFAEDAMVRGFVKVFQNLSSFRHEGSFEGWIRRIMVRESIAHLRKKQFVVFDEVMFSEGASEIADSSAAFDVEHIQRLIDGLPEGYRAVFVLYAIEGYKHQDIADILEISESTSKSQLFKARKCLQQR